jgi:hypothetical protein
MLKVTDIYSYMEVQRAKPFAGSARVSLASFFFVRAAGPYREV